MDIRYCPRCGQEVEPEDSFCFECGTELDASGGTTSSLRTLWATVLVSVLATLENVLKIVYADEMIEQAEQSGVGGEVGREALIQVSAIGVLVALTVLTVCYYYYREGTVDRRFFWGLIVAGVVGVLFGGTLLILPLIGIGAFGLLFED
jgi:ABC-type multidrug transport system permease subunit